MEMTNLSAFVEVAASGSFSAAAQRLHLTQPAVSRRVSSLEAELDLRLFDRVGRRILLTAAGTLLLPRARAMLAAMDDLRRILSNMSGEVAGTLRMGTSHHVGLHRLPAILRDYSRHYPAVRLDIRFLDSELACRQVERGNLEMAVVTLPPGPAGVLELSEIWHDPLQFVVGLEHPLAERTAIPAAELVVHSAVLPARGTYTRDILERALAAPGHPLRIGMSTNYLETLKMLVATGLGWTLLPETLIDPTLRVLRVDGLRLSRSLGVVRHPARTLSNAARAMLDACLSAAGVNPQRN